MFVPVIGHNGADILDDQNIGVSIFALGGDDTIYAHATDLSFVPQPWGGVLPTYAIDFIDGGAGDDMLSYIYAVTGVDVDLDAGTGYRIGNSGNYAPDLITNIENLIGSDFDDILHGDNNGNYIHGRFGDDEIDGHGGADLLVGGGGEDTLFGGAGGDTLWGDDDDDELHGETGDDTLEGGDGDDELFGGSGDDTLEGGDGDDVLDPGASNVAGTDTVIGGAGIDTIDFRSHGFSVDVDMMAGTATSGIANVNFSGIENVTTSIGNDTVVGDNAANHIQTGEGNDTVDALGGDDTIWSALGNDIVNAGAGDDTVSAAGGNDTVSGGDGEDNIIGASGNDVLRGNDDNDTIDAGVGNDWLFGGKGVNDLTTGLGFDVIAYEVGEIGFDIISDFDLSQDRFSFENGVLVSGPSVDLEDVLEAYAFNGSTFLMADLEGTGWRTIARLDGVDEGNLQAAIEDESILFEAQVVLEGPDFFFG